MDTVRPSHWEPHIRKLAVLAGSTMVILVANFYLGDPGQRLQTDWTAFDNAADRLLAGERIYVPWGQDEPLPYLYAPFALWLSLPLAGAGFFASWMISFALTALTSALGIGFLVKSTPKAVDKTTGLIVAATGGSFFGAAVLGQYSGMYVLSLGLALWLWTKDRHFLAGLALGILWLKPNFAIAIPVVLIWSRSWPALRGFLSSAVLAFVASLPFGLHLWSEAYFNVQDMGQRQVDGQLFESKFVSVLGGFQALTGAELLEPASLVVFFVVALVVGIATLIVWHPKHLVGNFDRAFGVLAVFVVVANTRVYFYDGAVAVFGVLALWFYSRRTHDRASSRWIAILALPLWIASWGNAFEFLNAYFGVFAAAIALVVARNALRESTFDSPEVGTRRDDIAHVAHV